MANGDSRLVALQRWAASTTRSSPIEWAAGRDERQRHLVRHVLGMLMEQKGGNRDVAGLGSPVMTAPALHVSLLR
jgi:hypothetical protein